MRFAYFVHPHLGGTYTVYACLRRGLAAHGIEVRWLGVGPGATALLDDASWAHERGHGEVVDLRSGSDAALARAMVEHILARGYDGVFVNVLASRVQTNAIRFMPAHVRRIMLVHNITPGTYAAARSVRDWVDATVGVSPRIRDDLVARHGFPADRTVAIGNAVDLAAFAAVGRSTGAGPLRLLSLGRIEDAAKGVFWLPEIAARLRPGEATLTIAGDGPDLAALRAYSRPLGERIASIGRVALAEVPGVMAAHDVLLVPSRFEGFGQTIIEAMAAGCVPVVSRIRGVTDTVVTDGKDGFLFPVGDVAAAAALVRRLAGDRALLARLSAAARRSAAARFDLARQAVAYAAVIASVTRHSPRAAPPLPWERWSYPAGLRPGLRSCLPAPLKNLLRTWKERMAA
jgi:glycosyltransferase involved in cell wall biosynthesis